jgi:hypothetical protein
MSVNTLLPKNVDVSKLRYSEVKSLSNGSKTVYINYGSDKLTLQTPMMSIPYGIGDWNEKNAKENEKTVKKDAVDGDKKLDRRYDLSVSFRGMDENPKLKAFHDKLQDLERKIKEDAFANRLTWLRDDFDGMKAFTDKMFTPFVKYDKDKDTGKVIGKYPPTLKVKLPYDNKNDNFVFDSFDMDENEVDFKSIMTKLKGAKVQLVIQLSGIWFAGGKYGCTWKVLMGKFQLPSKSKFTFVVDSEDEGASHHGHNKFEDDEELEEDALAMAQSSSPPPKPVAKKPAPPVEDDEEEEEDVPPPPAPKKSQVVLKVESEDEEEEPAEEEQEEEEEDDPTPPPPPKRGAKKTTTKAK